MFPDIFNNILIKYYYNIKIDVIKEFRIINNIKQESIAKYLNYSQNRYSEIENALKYNIDIYIKLSLLYNDIYTI